MQSAVSALVDWTCTSGKRGSQGSLPDAHEVFRRYPSIPTERRLEFKLTAGASFAGKSKPSEQTLRHSGWSRAGCSKADVGMAHSCDTWENLPAASTACQKLGALRATVDCVGEISVARTAQATAVSGDDRIPGSRNSQSSSLRAKQRRLVTSESRDPSITRFCLFLLPCLARALQSCEASEGAARNGQRSLRLGHASRRRHVIARGGKLKVERWRGTGIGGRLALISSPRRRGVLT